MKKKKDPNKVIAGIIGGQVTSERKAAAARENAKKGGRPKKISDLTPAESERMVKAFYR